MFKLDRPSLFQSVLILGLCSLLMFCLALPARALPSVVAPHLAQTANTVEDLQRQQQRKDEARSRLQRQRSQLQNLEQSAQKRLGGLQTSIKATSSQISQNETKLKQANQQLKKLEAALTKAEKSYQGKQSSTVARLRFLQRQQGHQGWALLLQSQDLNEFLDRRYQLRRVYQSDRQVLSELKAAADAIEKQRRNVESQKNQVALLTQELQAQKAEFQAQAKSQESLINRLRLDRKALEAAEEQLARDSANLAVLIQQRLPSEAPNRIVIRGTGRMSYPSDGEITSVYGYRVHPILGYTRFHSGVDFGVDYGSPIRAADSGVVIFAGWYGGYGQAVIIDHGSNLTTLYAHTSELYVSEGQTVQRGQVVAAVGSTGLSTGPHLHFEVRLDGETDDPMKYL